MAEKSTCSFSGYSAVPFAFVPGGEHAIMAKVDEFLKS